MSTRKRPDDDFDREIRAHLELEADRLVTDGLSPDAARAEARRRFGNVTAARERFYEAGRFLWLDHLRHDLRCAIRNIRRYPAAAIVAVASLGAGIGATTVTLTVRDTIFYKPPPLYQDAGELSKIQLGRQDRPVMPLGSNIPASLYRSWSEALGPAIAGSLVPRGVRDVRTIDRAPEPVPVRAIAPELFAMLGVRAEIGRTLSGWSPGTPGPTPAVISYRVWQRIFDARPDIIGQNIWIEQQPHTVVGVMPKRFWFSDMNSPIWTPLDPRTLAGEDEMEAVVRRPPGTTPAMLDAQLQAGLADYARHLPANQRVLRLKISPVQGTPIGNQVSVILPYVLGTSVLLTLIIACANVAVLMIAQWTAREHEIAIRASIGASRGRVVRALLTESVLIAACGGLLGVAATLILRQVIVNRGTESAFFDLSIDPIIFVQAAFITVLTGIAAGLAPALYETRRLQANPLRTLACSDRVRQRWRHALVILEITITVALLVETGAMVNGYQRARAAQMGFSPHALLGARVENPRGVPAKQVVDLMTRLPGVAAAAASTMVPYATFGPQVPVSSDAGTASAIQAERSAITGAFFSTLGVPLRAGRPFSIEDTTGSRVAIVNETLVKRMFAGRSPLGSRLWIAGEPHDVIGVVADYSNNPLRYPDVDPKVFVPIGSQPEFRRLFFVIRAEGDPAPLVPVVRREVRDGVAATIVTDAYTFDQILRVMGQEILAGTAPLVPLITIGMLLTSAGIYGVLAFAITRRAREFAVRMAIGASGLDMVRLVVAHTLRLVSIGTVVGVFVTFALSRFVRANGGSGTVFDPPAQAFATPVVILLVIGALATWIPSRRAVRIDPAVLLRDI
jgi:putative ABC transport system permease protein